MSDIFAPLREPDPVTAPAPDHVRRRGDRLRRRRTGLGVVGAVVAVVVAVAGPALVLGDRTTSGPPSPPADSPPGEEVIPALFDLADGLSRESVSSVAASRLTTCDEPFSLEDRATATERIVQGQRGDVTTRELNVFPSVEAARSVATRLVATLEGCPRSAAPGGPEWTTSVRQTTHGDQGWVVEQLVTMGGPRSRVPQVTRIVRLGPNLLVTQQREIHGLRVELLSRITGDQITQLMDRQMCLLTEAGCPWRSDPDVLRPDGWGPWRLGMTRDEIEATGVAGFSDAGDCTDVDLAPGHARLSEADGLVSIQVPEGVTTPDGIGLGTGRDEVLEKYAADEGDDVVHVRASPTADYEITLGHGQVTQLRLADVDNECSR